MEPLRRAKEGVSVEVGPPWMERTEVASACGESGTRLQAQMVDVVEEVEEAQLHSNRRRQKIMTPGGIE